MVGISHYFQRKQLRNIPSMSWQESHTKRDLDHYLDPRIAYIFEGLPYDKILRMVVGNRWSAIHPRHWPRRIRERTALYGEPVDIRDEEDIDVGLSKVRDWWERRGRFYDPILEAFKRDQKR